MRQIQPALKIDHLSADLTSRRLHIEASPDGIIAAILRLFKVGHRTELSMDSTGFLLKTRGFVGETRTYCSPTGTAASVFTRSRPIEYLALAVPLVCGGLVSLFGGGGAMVVGLILLVIAGLLFYVFLTGRNRVTVGIVTCAGTAESIKVKAKGHELKQFQHVVAIMESLLNEGTTSSVSPTTEESHFLPDDHSANSAHAQSSGASAETEVVHCPHCNARLKLRASRLGQVVKCPSCSERFQT